MQMKNRRLKYSCYLKCRTGTVGFHGFECYKWTSVNPKNTSNIIYQRYIAFISVLAPAKRQSILFTFENYMGPTDYF